MHPKLQRYQSSQSIFRVLSKKRSGYKGNRHFSIINSGVWQFCVQLQKLFLQMKGCAMRTICAPAYASIFMNHFKRKYVYSFLGLSLSDLRFIVDIFFLWTGSKDQLITFLNDFNTMHNLTILTGKKHPKIKLQFLRKIWIWTSGSLVHQINSF